MATTVKQYDSKFDWLSRIEKSELGIQDYYYVENGIDPNSLTREELEELKGRVDEKDMFITMKALSSLAHDRGLISVEYEPVRFDNGYFATKCTVKFSEKTIDKVYFPEQTFSAMANATEENTQYPFSMFLEPLAENRAFMRACRRALNISVVGYEELEKERPSSGRSFLGGDDDGDGIVAEKTPQESLRNYCEVKKISFSKLKESLLSKGDWDSCKEWGSWEDIPSPSALEILCKAQQKASGK